MLRLALIIVLIAVTASAKHVKKVKRINEDINESCYGEAHPSNQCRPRDCTYPTVLVIERSRSTKDMKRILLHGDNLEKLCSEARKIINCIISAYGAISAECHEEYEKNGQFLLKSVYDNGAAFWEKVCTDDVFESIRTNLGCITEEDLLKDVDSCQYPNRDRNCSGIDYRVDPDASNNCYREKYRKNCNVDQAISCSSKKVTTACSEDAGDLIELLGNAFFKTLKVYYCPSQAGGKEFRHLLKFFKK